MVGDNHFLPHSYIAGLSRRTETMLIETPLQEPLFGVLQRLYTRLLKLWQNKQMKMRKDIGFGLFVLGMVLSAVHVFGGHPGPPKRHSAEYRQANALMLRFQDALAAERWNDALGFCSDNLRARALQTPSPEAFFRETMPIERVLAHDFGCWTCSSNCYGHV